MKAYKDAQGRIRLFRPDCNFERMSNSMVRLAMPPLDSEGFFECLKWLVQMEKSWIPDMDGYAIYIRPTAIGNSPFLGVAASDHVKLFCILSPVGPYYKHGFVPVKLYADTKNVRAWPGGAGNAKVGGNYAPTIAPAKEALKHGCQQIMWLFGPEHHVTEVGAMNIFFLLKKADGKVELVTAPLTRGDILPGVTRRSILEMTREWTSKTNPIAVASAYGDVEVSERFLPMAEVVEASKSGRVRLALIHLYVLYLTAVTVIVVTGSFRCWHCGGNFPC
jgi:branched-chain amino acid aminotransferase